MVFLVFQQFQDFPVPKEVQQFEEFVVITFNS